MAARERFPARVLSETDGELWLVELTEVPSAVYLTRQATLDVLGVDDRVSTGRIDTSSRAELDPLLDTCGQLADAVFDWWATRPPPLVYRSRTAPAAGRNLAFVQTAMPRVASSRRLRHAGALHAHLVLRAGFSVPDTWLLGLSAASHEIQWDE